MSAFPQVAADDLPWVSADEMREVDRVMVDDLGIELLQMMENAGANLARFVLDVHDPADVVVYAGPGGNGGGGLAAARHLHNAGVEISVVRAAQVDRFSPAARHQLDICDRLGITVVDEPRPAAVVVEALIGYGLRGSLRPETAGLIDAVNAAATVVSLDVPAGLDSTTGATATPHVRATETLTLAAPKTGMRGAPSVGDLYVADISVPPAVVDQVAGSPMSFRSGRIVRVASL